MALSTNYQIIPTSEAPAQLITITLNQQHCDIKLYTKSINVPIYNPGDISTDPPVYENANPVFMDLYVNNISIVGGVLCLDRTTIVRDIYLGFIGDLAIIDTQGREDPFGVPATLPLPADLRNWWQRNIPLRFGGKAPPAVAGKIPGLGTRFILTYRPNLA